jgi:hypothetical protein
LAEVTMSEREIDRLYVIRKVLERRFTWTQAAEQLKVGRRQVARLCRRYRALGARGLVHGLRGKASNHRLAPELLGKALSALHDPLWEGFGPTFGGEKLAEHYGLRLGVETTRQLMIGSGLWTVRRSGPKHRSWRPPKDCVGMMVQMDGSHHDWFEGRGPRCVLMGMIDDATSRILYAEFVDSEDTLNVMRVTKAYIERFGRPTAIYVDKDSIFQTNREAAIEEDLRQEQPATQYKRALDELGIELICAHSPQAKGRIERSFNTHQDRLVKELRLAGIGTMEGGNRLLHERYLQAHNERFARPPASPVDAHRPVLAGHDLSRILSIWSQRTVLNDYTLRFKSSWLQLVPAKGLRLRPKDKVTIETRLDGTTRARWKGGYVAFKALEKRPYKGFLVTRPSEFPTKDEVRGAVRRARRLSGSQRRMLGLSGYNPKGWIETLTPETIAPSFI